MTHLTTAQLHRSAGVLLGAAAGDALGAGYEFRSNPPRHAEMIGGGPFHFAPGEWTDDTQMSICVAEVAATGNLDPAAVGERFLEWYRGRPRDVGNQTRTVLEQARHGRDCAVVAAEYFRRNPHNAAGNGSLMRTAPVALAHLGDTTAMAGSARAISELTHADPQAGDACALWCAAIGHAVIEGSLQGAPGPHELLAEGRAGRWAGRVQEAETAPRRTFSHNGYVVTAFQAAHAAVHQTPVPEAMPCLHLQDPCGPPSISATTPTPWPPSPAPSSGRAGACLPSPSPGGGCCTGGRATGRRIWCALLC
jgi:ADP-ribosyl-[dinitrogen reductase] hydrolase